MLICFKILSSFVFKSGQPFQGNDNSVPDQGISPETDSSNVQKQNSISTTFLYLALGLTSDFSKRDVFGEHLDGTCLKEL